MAVTPRIFAWDRKKCAACRRERVHFRTATGWHCIGSATWAADIVVPHGKRRRRRYRT